MREDVGGVVKEYVYGLNGELTVLDGSHNLMQTETNFDGRYLGTREATTFVWALGDELGTVRMRTNAGGASIETDTSWPFGANLNNVGAYSNLHFTGKYRDSETGLDDFGARYYSSNLGRFLTPDWSAAPEAIPYANLSNPQSLNLYNYTLNNPVTGTDPDGHICIFGIGNTCGHKSKAPALESGVAGSDTLAELGDFVGEIGGAAVAAVGSEALLVLATVNQAGSGTDPASVAYRKREQSPTTGGLKRRGARLRPTATSPPKRGAGADGQMVKNPNGPGRGYLDKDGDVWVPTGEGPTAHGGPHWDVQSPGGGYRNVYPGGSVRPGSGGNE